MSDATITRMRTRRLATARRCWRNRRTTIFSWLRASTVNSRSVVPGCIPGGWWSPAAGTAAGSRRTSVIPDPRVEIRVQDIGHQVEEDHDDRRDHEPRQQLVHVDVVHGVDA